MMQLTRDNIEKFLKKKEIPVQFQEETEQLYVTLKFQRIEYPLFMRIYEGETFLQLLLFIPCEIQAGCEGDTARVLHLINREIDIPGYGMDESAKALFYRLMLPAYNKQIDGEFLYLTIRSLEKLCETFSPPIIAIAQGNMSYSQLLTQLAATASEEE